MNFRFLPRLKQVFMTAAPSQAMTGQWNRQPRSQPVRYLDDQVRRRYKGVLLIADVFAHVYDASSVCNQIPELTSEKTCWRE
ncbi:MAG: hypothetical protein NVSMB2_25530 [Chloroflexota bacterium]